ncbi:MAG: hypothetical protein SFW63_06415 [Alphaproteobacteria bacterium]|nr:hypothetical protein [Alphaproteobacteria bacterium]
MVKSVDHGVVSGTATVAYDTVKGGVKGLLAAAAIGAVLVGGGAAILGAGLAGVIGFGVAGAAASALIGGPVATAVGAVAGLFGGYGRVKNEKAAFENRESTVRESLAAREQAIAQQAFAMGAQAGQQSVIAELQKHQEMMIRSQMAQAAGQKPVLGSHTANVVDKRAAQQAAGAQPQVA